MAAAVKKTISLPAELAREAEALAKAEGKTLSAVVQDALRHARIGRRQDALSRSWIGAMRSSTTAPPTMNTERQPQCWTSRPAQIGPNVRPA